MFSVFRFVVPSSLRKSLSNIYAQIRVSRTKEDSIYCTYADFQCSRNFKAIFQFCRFFCKFSSYFIQTGEAVNSPLVVYTFEILL